MILELGSYVGNLGWLSKLSWWGSNISGELFGLEAMRLFMVFWSFGVFGIEEVWVDEWNVLQVLRLLTYSAWPCRGIEAPSRGRSQVWSRVSEPRETNGRCRGRSRGGRSHTGSRGRSRRRACTVEGRWSCWWLAGRSSTTPWPSSANHYGWQQRDPPNVKRRISSPVRSLRATVGATVGETDRNHLHWAVLVEVFSAMFNVNFK